MAVALETCTCRAWIRVLKIIVTSLLQPIMCSRCQDLLTAGSVLLERKPGHF